MPQTLAPPRPLPELVMGRPAWFHHHGFKMRVTSFDATKRLLIITDSAAKLVVSQAGEPGTDQWFLDWEVVQTPYEKTTGRTRLTSSDLCAAFGVTTPNVDEHQAQHFLFSRYGAETATQAGFIRWKEFLNIPCPGTGHDGDPNISIFLDIAMREAVKTLTSRK